VSTPPPAPYAGPQGPASLGTPLAPDPVPPPAPAGPPAPHPDEEFVPGQMAWYSYHDHRDPEGRDRVQLVAVTHVTDDHVHGLVLGDARNLASFARGVLTHQHPGP
jgi:hypothetical protein